MLRIWNPQLNRFVDGGEWFVNPSGEVFFLDLMDGELIGAPNWVVSLASGVKDKNGQIIYQGDLIKGHFGIKVVTILEGSFWVGDTKYFLNNADKWESLGALGYFAGNCEVVGNIYEK